MKRVLLGLGSNKSYKDNSPLDILRYACGELSGYLVKPSFSSVYKTRAMYVEDQDDFYNMCVLGFVADDLNAYDFLKYINEVEAKYGRDRSREIRFGSRSLDIDIELFGEEKFNDSLLQVPHPRICERMFVLVPAIEVLKKSADKIIRDNYIKSLNLLKEKEDINTIIKIVPQQVVLKWNRK